MKEAKRLKKLSVIKLQAKEIAYIKRALDWYVEENIYHEDGTGFKLVERFMTYMSDRPNVFDLRTPELEYKDEDDDDYY